MVLRAARRNSHPVHFGHRRDHSAVHLLQLCIEQLLRVVQFLAVLRSQCDIDAAARPGEELQLGTASKRSRHALYRLSDLLGLGQQPGQGVPHRILPGGLDEQSYLRQNEHHWARHLDRMCDVQLAPIGRQSFRIEAARIRKSRYERADH